MIVNTKNTGLVCVSGATSFEARAHLLDEGGHQVDSIDLIKILGFFIDSDARVWLQVNVVCVRLRSRSWALSRLKKCGLKIDELVRVYRSCIRPCAEYAAVVLHPMLTDEQTECIEAQQTNALRNIFGYGVSASRMRSKAKIQTLAERRFAACKKFAQQLAGSPRFAHWVEQRPVAGHARRSKVTYGEFKELPAKTLRCYKSPLYLFRRLLNGRALK